LIAQGAPTKNNPLEKLYIFTIVAIFYITFMILQMMIQTIYAADFVTIIGFI